MTCMVLDIDAEPCDWCEDGIQWITRYDGTRICQNCCRRLDDELPDYKKKEIRLPDVLEEDPVTVEKVSKSQRMKDDPESMPVRMFDES